jgi:hypothetical protein
MGAAVGVEAGDERRFTGADMVQDTRCDIGHGRPLNAKQVITNIDASMDKKSP